MYAKALGPALLSVLLYKYLTWDSRWWWKKRESAPFVQVVTAGDESDAWIHEMIHGTVEPGWEAVRDEFIENFRVRGELGASCCVYFKGRKVVDLWGGLKDRQGEKGKWEKDTLVNVFSTTKGITSLAVALQHSKGKLDFDTKIVSFWPEFAQNGKTEVTVRDVLDHAAGLAGPSPPITLETLQDKGKTNDFLARTEMEWPRPYDKKGYMAILLGLFSSTFIQKTDPQGRTAGEFLRDEVFTPLKIEDEIYVGLPKSIPDARVATLDGPEAHETLFMADLIPKGLIRKIILEPWTYTARAFQNPRLSIASSVMDYNEPKVREVELPAANGHATARALAKIYSAVERAINSNGTENVLQFTKDTLTELQAPARPSRLNGWYDETLLSDSCAFSLGMLKPGPKDAKPGKFGAFSGAGDHRAFGTPGAGGSFAFCDPSSEMAFAYTMNRCGVSLMDDPREFALRFAAFESAARQSGGETLSLDRIKNNIVPFHLSKAHMDKFPHLAPMKR